MPAREFDFVSAVDASLSKQVEALFFFHPRQKAWLGPIRANVEAFGAPQILERSGRIHVGIERNGAQCLFACHRQRRPGMPVGVVVYLRTSTELLHILHLAVDPAYGRGGPHEADALAARLVGEVRSLARRISGVRRVQLPYGQGRFLAVAPLAAG